LLNGRVENDSFVCEDGLTKEPSLNGRLSTVDLRVKEAYFVKKEKK
jgi:hypothetical protein